MCKTLSNLQRLVKTFTPATYKPELGANNLQLITASQASTAPKPTVLPSIPELRTGVTEALSQNGLQYPKDFTEASYSKTNIGDMDCFVYKTEAPATAPTLVMFYGGGFCLDTLSAHKAFMANIATQTKCNIILPDYPLSPENKAPEITEKGETFLLDLITHSTNLGFSDNIMLMGWSSGSNMVLTLSLNLLKKAQALFKRKVKRLFLFSPWVDLTLTVSRKGPFLTQQAMDKTAAGPDLLEIMARCYLPEGMKGDEPAYCPAFRTSEELRELPPISIITGGCEVLFGDAVFLANRLKLSGTPTELIVLAGQTHNYMVFQSISQDGVYVPSLIANKITNTPIDAMQGKDGLGLIVHRFNH